MTRALRITWAVSFLLFCSSGCVAPEPVGKPALDGRGAVVIYLQPFPQDARDLRFSVQSMAAVQPEGDAIALELNFHDFFGAALIGRQRRLAAEALPPGIYHGLRLHIGAAFRQSEEGEAAMLVADPEVFIPHHFEVYRGQATALFLEFDSSGGPAGDIVFAPGFSITRAARHLIALYGYASNADSNLLTVFNKKTMQVTNSIATGRRPAGLAVDNRRRRLFVACSGADRIEEIDILQGAVVGQITMRLGDQPLELALTPDGRLLVSANYGSNTVSIIDAGSRIERERVSVGQKPTDVVVDAAGRRAFVVNSRSNSVSVVDLDRSALAGSLPVETTPLRAAIEPRSERLFVIHRNSPNLLAVDTRALTVVQKIFAGLGALSLTSDSQTGLVYVGYRSGEIAIVDPSALMFVDSISLASPVASLTIGDQENSLFALQPEKRMLLRINLTSKRVQSELEVGEDAYAVAVVEQR